MIMAVLMEVTLFALSFIFPGFGLAIPAVRVKKMIRSSLSTNIISQVIIITVIAFYFREAVVLYFILFFLTEILFFVFKKYNRVLSFDKVIIGTTVITFIFFVVVQFSDKYLISLKQEITKAYTLFEAKYVNIQQHEQALLGTNQSFGIEDMFKIFSEYYLIMVFGYVLLATLIMYYINDEKIKSDNRVSYIFVLVFVVAFLLEQFYMPKNIYLINIMLMVQFSYAVQAALLLEKMIGAKSQMRTLTKGLVWMMPFLFMDGMFIVGALNSFRKVRKNKDKSDDKELN